MFIVWEDLGYDGHYTTECETWAEAVNHILYLVDDGKHNRESFNQWLLGKTNVMHINGHDTFITSKALPANHNECSAAIDPQQIR